MDSFGLVKCPLHEDEYRLLRDFISHYSGIFFDDGHRTLLEKRLQKRLEDQHLESFRDYYHRLVYEPDREEEVGYLLDLLTTNETYFFREWNQLRVFSEEIVPEIAARPGGERRIRVWSAGCSTGEEPYTLAILMLESPHLAGWHREVMATDISQRVLRSAREGVYGRMSFRATEQRYLDRYFQPHDEGRLRIRDEVRALVTFGHTNIMQSSTWPVDGSFDVVVCRNVLIYFSPEAKRKAVANLERKLKPGGYLLLGHAESLINISTSFVLRHFKYDMVFQKPAASAAFPDDLPIPGAR